MMSFDVESSWKHIEINNTYVFAKWTTNVERYRHDVVFLDVLNTSSNLDYFSSDLVSQNQTLRSISAASNHVLVRSTNVRGKGSNDDRVASLQFRIFNIPNLDYAWFYIHNCTIAFAMGSSA